MKFREFKPKVNILPLIIFASFCFLLYACGSGGDSSGESTSGNGSIQFNLIWDNSSATQHAGNPPSGDVCVDYAIDTLNATVTSAANDEIGSASWNCSDHGGTIDKVEAGTGITLTIDALVGSNADWRGQMTDIVVSDNQDTDVGTIVMSYRGTDVTAPTVSSNFPANGAGGIFLNTVIIVTFSENVVAASVNTTSCTVSETVSTNPVTINDPVFYDSSTQTAIIIPSSPLNPSLSYTVTITTDIEDIAGNHLASSETWSFTTGTITGDMMVWDTSNWDESVWN